VRQTPGTPFDKIPGRAKIGNDNATKCVVKRAAGTRICRQVVIFGHSPTRSRTPRSGGGRGGGRHTPGSEKGGAPRRAGPTGAPPQKRRQARTRQPDGAGSLGATTPAGRTDQRTASEDAREEPQRRDCGRGAGDSGRRTYVETQRARQARGAAHGTGEAHGAGWREGGDRMDARRGALSADGTDATERRRASVSRRRGGGGAPPHDTARGRARALRPRHQGTNVSRETFEAEGDGGLGGGREEAGRGAEGGGAGGGRQPRASRAPGHRPESRRGRPDAQRAKKKRRPRAGWARGGARPGRRKGWAAETPTINVPASPAGGLPGCGQRGSRGRGGTRPVAARRGQAIPARHQAGPRPGGAGRVPRGIRPGRAGITGRAASPADAGAGTSSRPAG